MPGPAPKPADQRRRRNVHKAAAVLPPSGRQGPAPAWPLAGEEPATWSSLWSSPQAVEWERLSLQRVVARYARVLAASEAVDATAALLGEARQLEDRLGLSAMAMRRLEWEVGVVESAPGEQPPAIGQGRARDRLRSVG